MISLNGIGYEIAGRWLFQNINLTLSPGQRIGLVGRNGTGKTTLLRLINGDIKPSEGTINAPKHAQVGFLTQDMLEFRSDEPIINVAVDAFHEMRQMEQEINELLEKPEAEQDEQWLERLTHLQEQYYVSGGYEMEARAHEVLDGLGFSDNDRQRPFSVFSGGWRMRVMLARLLLREPDVLLLDEPTNHLDLPAIEWLESYLARYSGTTITVSHDRDFLDRMTNETLELRNQRIESYPGNFSFYLQAREERYEQQRQAYENQQKFIADTERFIERFRAQANKASQVQSKIKMLDKLERIPPPEPDEPEINFHFQLARKPGREVLSLKHLNKSFGATKVLEDAAATLERGDKVGLIGPNGVGKSTLLRILNGAEAFDGERTVGYRVDIALFAQHVLESLNPNNTIFQELYNYAYERGETFVRTILGGFMFSGDEIEKPIHVLSGGERSRVALARTLLSEANTLLLDEPTNHLDMKSMEVLIKALQEYEGSFVIVSHNRYFLRQVANKIWFIEDYQLKEFPGTYDEYEYHRQQERVPQLQAPAVSVTGNGARAAAHKHANGAAPNNEPPAPQLDRKERKQLQNRRKKLEERIEQLEQAQADAEQRLADPAVATDPDKLRETQAELKTTQDELAAKMQEWEATLASLGEL
jgi:ATP-binding cassette subfamily F protein 3